MNAVSEVVPDLGKPKLITTGRLCAPACWARPTATTHMHSCSVARRPERPRWPRWACSMSRVDGSRAAAGGVPAMARRGLSTEN